MTKPFPIGIRLPESSHLFDAYDFPKGDVIFGFFANGKNTENTIAFLEFIMN
jgi:hypothetical protein